MWANSVWGFFGLAVTLGLAVLGLPPDLLWMRPWFLYGAATSFFLSVGVLCWPLRLAENRTFVATKIRHPIQWMNEWIAPTYVIIAVLTVILAGVLWQRQPSLIDPHIADLRKQFEALQRDVNSLRQDLNAEKGKAFFNTGTTVQLSADKPLSPRAVRELLGALNEANSLQGKFISPTIGQINSWAANWKGVIRNNNGVLLYSRLQDELKTQVWDKIDTLIENNKTYQTELEAAFALDHRAAKNDVSRALQAVIEAIKRLPPNSPPEADDLLEPQFRELLKQSNIGWEWVSLSNKRIQQMLENINSRGIVAYDK
jgi:hypothetical protein